VKKGTKGKAKVPVRDWLFLAVILAANINIFLNWLPIYETPGESSLRDLILGGLLIVIALETTRRSTGWVLPVILVFTFIYVFMGPRIPGSWGHTGFSLKFVIDSVYFSPIGIYGAMTGYSATFVAVFIIFGSLLMVTGGGETFIDLALLVAGKFRGGPAKVAVVSSALFGTISGSPTANVSVCGTYTIPLMKRLGYDRNFAGGVEAMASTGGIITPPVMGITAFVMAEWIGVPYIKIAMYAIIPCALFYIGIFAGVHFEALRLKLSPVPKNEIPHWKKVLTPSRLVPFCAPLIILIWLLLSGYDLTDAGFYSCMAVIVFYLVKDFSLLGMKKRVVDVVKALSNGGQSLAMIVPVFVTVGMLVNLLGITGIAPKISGVIVDMGSQYLIGGLLTGAIVPLVLGTALPTTATYLISIPLIAPALIRLNLDIVSVHMFLFYWAALAAVTPPTCVPCIVAARIAGGHWMKVSMAGMRLGIVAFLMPFFFILEPALLARGALTDILLHSASGVVGAFLLASALSGYMRNVTNPAIRLLYGISGLMLLYPSYPVHIWGVGIALVAFACDWLLGRLRQKTLISPSRNPN
ncbi:MAG: TRAP transporter fused permease subunit, partial [Dehalococcoidales bacterium]|nr:TRAP transporter fused permease subunit [Dehalococcoidales bacterium]